MKCPKVAAASGWLNPARNVAEANKVEMMGWFMNRWVNQSIRLNNLFGGSYVETALAVNIGVNACRWFPQ